MGRAQLSPTPRRQDARRERQAQDRDKTQPEEDREDREASTVADRPDRNEGGEQQAEEKKKATPARGQQRRGGKHCCRQPRGRTETKSTISKNIFLRIVVTYGTGERTASVLCNYLLNELV